MVAKKGKYYFGFWDGVYGSPTDAYEDFMQYKNTIDKESVISILNRWMIGSCAARVDSLQICLPVNSLTQESTVMAILFFR